MHCDATNHPLGLHIYRHCGPELKQSVIDGHKPVVDYVICCSKQPLIFYDMVNLRFGDGENGIESDGKQKLDGNDCPSSHTACRDLAYSASYPCPYRHLELTDEAP